MNSEYRLEEIDSVAPNLEKLESESIPVLSQNFQSNQLGLDELDDLQEEDFHGVSLYTLPQKQINVIGATKLPSEMNYTSYRPEEEDDLAHQYATFNKHEEQNAN